MDRKAKVAAVLGLIALAARAHADGAPADDASFARRRYALKLPAGWNQKTPAPLVLAVHCYGCDSDSFRRWFKLDALADERGFVLAAPDGKRDARDRRFFNATESCCDFDGRGVDDAGYLAWVIADVRAHYAIDPKRIFVLGYSNGGFMAHRLACDQSQVIAGVVSIAGGAPRACAPREPVAILEIHGDADEVVPYGGGSLVGLPKMPPLASVPGTIDAWAKRNGCSAVEKTPLGRITIERRGGCRAPVELWTVHGGHHIPDEKLGSLAHALDFLFAHPKP